MMIEISQPPFCQTDVTGSTVNLKVLNLYCGIGGNRKLWQNVDVTAVEYNEEIASIYKEYYPNDTVIVTDAHEYLVNHYAEFDFIWTSPPCPTHTRMALNFADAKAPDKRIVPKFPDMKLYQEIIFLDNFFKGKYCVENVIPYYKPLITPTVDLERHLFWANFKIPKYNLGSEKVDIVNMTGKSTNYGFNISDKKIKHRKDQILRNLVNPELGLYIFEQANGILRQPKTNQVSLFDGR
jgi:DNA (cytosine-5)-methyltransferase 1